MNQIFNSDGNTEYTVKICEKKEQNEAYNKQRSQMNLLKNKYVEESFQDRHFSH